MFSLFTSGEVTRDAERLHVQIELAKDKYLGRPSDEVRQILPLDFPQKLVGMDNHAIQFVYPEAPDFAFLLQAAHESDRPTDSLMVQGLGKYAGFTLHVADHGDFFTVSDGIAHRATGAARQLGKIMRSRFGVEDMTKRLGR